MDKSGQSFAFVLGVQAHKEMPADRVATIEEVREAIDGMSAAELLKLEKYSRFRIRGLGRKAKGKDHEDLMRDAITLTLSGDRRWKKRQVPFLIHLLGVIRSISSHLAQKPALDEALLEAELREEGKSTAAVFDTARSSNPSIETVLVAQESLKQIYRRFDEDKEVQQILEGLKEQMTGPDIQAHFGFTKKKFEAAMRRLRRGASALLEQEII